MAALSPELLEAECWSKRGLTIDESGIDNALDRDLFLNVDSLGQVHLERGSRPVR